MAVYYLYFFRYIHELCDCVTYVGVIWHFAPPFLLRKTKSFIMTRHIINKREKLKSFIKRVSLVIIANNFGKS